VDSEKSELRWGVAQRLEFIEFRNIGQDDLIRRLRALAQASGLEYGSDIRFPLAHK
jgi:hypothetical protein